MALVVYLRSKSIGELCIGTFTLLTQKVAFTEVVLQKEVISAKKRKNLYNYF